MTATASETRCGPYDESWTPAEIRAYELWDELFERHPESASLLSELAQLERDLVSAERHAAVRDHGQHILRLIQGDAELEPVVILHHFTRKVTA